MHIPFNKPYMTGRELEYIAQAHANKHLAGNGVFTRRCQDWMQQRLGCRKVLLTHSCTAALEMAALLAELQPGDEVILPSFTFVSTANAFVLRGAVPVFVDVRPDTLNLDETRVEAAITSRTRVIVAVHYAGVPAEMDALRDIADRHGLLLIEDAAQAVLSQYRGRPAGSLGHLAAVSFHETKNVISGEGGALLINDPRFLTRSEILWEKGTNRSALLRGEVDKYTWIDVGSSFLPSELIAAFLWAQLEQADDILARRLHVWDSYHKAFASLENRGVLRRPCIPQHCRHNAHMYYLLLDGLSARTRFIRQLKEQDISAVFHYVPLHSAPAGQRYGRAYDSLSVTDRTSDSLVRLPLWLGIEGVLPRIIAAVYQACQAASPPLAA
ncbi:MAG TPA: dTDP-4-amino-4,6-dideoxygalactose transaminase [Gemmataceae bacterium]|nr:dTDP-4-amino-4,6-dideoxygalactose transaminase [Gemmataceae bacterium]